MTVADNTSRNQYTATSGQTVFAYTFEIVDKDHIVVLQNGTALSEGTDYTVSSVGNDSGGNVTLTSGATAGDVMTLYRDMPYSRTQNYTNSGDFLASEVNSDFDNLWLAGEQTDRSFSQSIRKPITDSDSISMELPEAADRADKYLTFTSTGAVSVADVTTSLDAADVTISDAGGYYTSGNVEGALQEVGADITTIQSDITEIDASRYLSVKDFGAKGDGTTDDTTAIQNAINHASTRNIQTIFFPDGHYKYTTLRFYHDQTDNTGFQGTNIYTGDGSDTTFDFGWYIESASDLTVTVNDVEQTLDTDYTVSGVGSDTGGTVTFTTAPGNTLEVKIASPNRDGRFQLRGTGRLSINDLKNYTGSNADRLYGSILEATGDGIIVEPTGGFGTTDARNFVAKDLSFVANNTGYILRSETCPGMTFDHCSFKQLNAGGSGLKVIGSWFFTMNQCYVFGAWDDNGTYPETNTGDGIEFGSNDFAGLWNIIDSLIDSWKNGLRWNSDQSFVNVSVRNTAIQNCSDYGILVDDGTIHQLLLDNVYFENQANKPNVGQGISYISDNSLAPGRIRNLRIINNFFLGIHGPATLATTTGPMIDLAVIDFIDIEGSFAYRPAKTFLNIDDTIDAQDICGEIKNTFFLTDRAFPTTPLFLLTGILPNVHNCRWPGYEDGIYNTTNDCQLFDSTTDGQYLREYTDPIMGSTNISKFSFGDSNVETVTSSPYTINDAGFNEAKTYYDLTHTLAGGLAVRLPDVNEKGDGRLFIIKNNENSASSFPYIQVYNNSDQVNFIARLSPGQAGLFIYDGQGTGTFKYVGRTFHDDIVLADDHKITFGRSDDLQLFHQSSDSTNRLVSGGTSFALPTADGTAGQSLTTDGAGNLTFSTAAGTGIQSVVEDTTPQLGGNLDLNGSDITGTGNLNFTGSINTILNVDGTTEDVQITGAVPALELIDSDNSNAKIRYAWNNQTMFQSMYGPDLTTWASLVHQTRLSDGSSNQVVYTYDATNDRHWWGTRASGDVLVQVQSDGKFNVNGGDVSFENSTGTSENFYWDASTSRLGLGTTLPSNNLHVNSAGNTVAKISSTFSGSTTTGLYIDTVGDTSAARLLFSKSGVTRGIIGYSHNASANSEAITFNTAGGTERMRINATGVGINNIDPDARLDVTSQNTTDVAIKITDAQAETGGSQNYNINMITKFAAEQFTLYNTDTYRNMSWIGFDNFGQEITFGTGAAGSSTERMVINSSGNVGISNTAPLENLHIGDGTSPVALTLQGTDAGTNAINMGDATNRLAGRILYDNSLNDFRFVAGGSERVRIKGSGDLLVGCTSTPSATINGFGVNPAGVVRTSRSGTTAASHYIFYNDNGDVGSIDTSGTSTSYTTSSDRRLKDNIVDAPSASDDIDAIQVRSFDWKADGSHQKYGMVAQELQTVAPEAVTEGETEEDMMGVDYSKLVPMLVKEIQSLRARVAQLEGAE